MNNIKKLTIIDSNSSKYLKLKKKQFRTKNINDISKEFISITSFEVMCPIKFSSMNFLPYFKYLRNIRFCCCTLPENFNFNIIDSDKPLIYSGPVFPNLEFSRLKFTTINIKKHTSNLIDIQEVKNNLISFCNHIQDYQNKYPIYDGSIKSYQDTKNDYAKYNDQSNIKEHLKITYKCFDGFINSSKHSFSEYDLYDPIFCHRNFIYFEENDIDFFSNICEKYKINIYLHVYSLGKLLTRKDIKRIIPISDFKKFHIMCHKKCNNYIEIKEESIKELETNKFYFAVLTLMYDYINGTFFINLSYVFDKNPYTTN